MRHRADHGSKVFGHANSRFRGFGWTVVIAALLISSSGTAMTRIASTPEGMGQPDDELGLSVALLGDTAAVGAPGMQGVSGQHSGVVEVYRESGASWTREAVLEPSDAAPQMQFGTAVGLGQEFAVVSAVHSGSSGAAIYTFERNGSAWSQVDRFDYAASGLSPGTLSVSGDTFLATGGAIYVRQGSGWALQTQLAGDEPSEIFGVSVALDGDVAIVTSFVRPSLMIEAAYVYFFARNGTTWTREAKVDLGDSVGYGVAVSGSTALVLTADSNGLTRVRSFLRNDGTWLEGAELDAGAPITGLSLVIDGDTAVVASSADPVGDNIAAGTAYVFERSNGVWSRTDHIYDTSAERYDAGFASSLALSGSNLLVGVPTASSLAGFDSGKALMFEPVASSWQSVQTLEEGSAHALEAFGTGVALSATTLIAGAPWARGPNPLSIGVAYVYERSGGEWSPSVVLHPTSETTQMFGQSISLDGDTVVLGAADDDQVGAAYVFTRGQGDWPLQARVIGDALDPEYFGWSTALSGDLLAVGQPAVVGTTPSGPPGKVHVFHRSSASWSLQQTLQPDDLSSTDDFGYSLALSDDVLLVGAPRADTGIETDSGAVYVFVNAGGTWIQQQKLFAPLVARDAHFGLSVALTGNTAVIGAGDEDASSSVRGAAYLYARNGGTWSWQATLAPQQGSTPGSFGHAVAISGDESVVLVGAPVTSAPAPATGAVYRFERDGGSWVSSNVLRGSPPQSLYGDDFGASLAMSGNEAAIGAPNDGLGGAAYQASVGDEIFSGGFDAAP